MKYGARNTIKATVTTVKKGEIMAQVDFKVTEPCKMSSVLTAESVEELGLAPGDQVVLVVKAVNVMPVKE